MRDNSIGMPEIVDAYERDSFFFGAIGIAFESGVIVFEFGVDRAGFNSLRRVLESHPLGKMPGQTHRYFFAGGYSRELDGTGPVTFSVRIESDGEGKKFEFEGPLSLVSNLLWFSGLKSAEEASSLRRIG